MELNKKITLKHPVKFEGREVKEINLDLQQLTGGALKRAERGVAAAGGVPMGPMSSEFCIACAVQVAGEPPELFDQLAGPDYIEVGNAVQAFLMGAESVMTDSGKFSSCALN